MMGDGMKQKEVIERLNGLSRTDPEVAHVVADDILLEFLRANNNGQVADAWEIAKDRVGFWYS